jgi:hypothetical protein
MNTHELCINLWYCVDANGLVNAIAGRGYDLTGTDDQKLAILYHLAASDFHNVTWLPLPENISTVLVDSQTGQSETFKSVIHASTVDRLGIDLFETVLQDIERVEQNYLPVIESKRVKVPDEPLYVLTPVFNDGVRMKAVVS